MDAEFSERLRRLRKAKKLTLQEVADQIGCTKAYVWALEKRPGQQRPTAERVLALANVLGVSLADLMGLPPVTGGMGANETGSDGAPHPDEVFKRDFASARPEEKRILQDVLNSLIRNRSDANR